MGLPVDELKRIKEGYEPTPGKTPVVSPVKGGYEPKSPVKGGYEAKSPVKGGYEAKAVSPVKGGKGNDPTPNFP